AAGQRSSSRSAARPYGHAMRSGDRPVWMTSNPSASSRKASASCSSRARCAGLRQHDPVNLAEKVREVPDWPQPGVGFKDVAPLLADPPALRYSIEQLSEWGAAKKPDLVLGAEPRGFILGAAIAKDI